MLGEKIRQRRTALGLTLRRLGEETDLTASFLSQVEKGQTSPSIASLQRVAAALQQPIFAFLEDDDSPLDPVVRRDERKKLIFPDSQIAYDLLCPSPTCKIMGLQISLEPGGVLNAARLRQPTEQLMLVLQGEMDIQIGDQRYSLREGDSIYFDGEALREFAAAGEEPLRIICCLTPPVF